VPQQGEANWGSVPPTQSCFYDRRKITGDKYILLLQKLEKKKINAPQKNSSLLYASPVMSISSSI